MLNPAVQDAKLRHSTIAPRKYVLPHPSTASKFVKIVTRIDRFVHGFH